MSNFAPLPSGFTVNGWHLGLNALFQSNYFPMNVFIQKISYPQSSNKLNQLQTKKIFFGKASIPLMQFLIYSFNCSLVWFLRFLCYILVLTDNLILSLSRVLIGLKFLKSSRAQQKKFLCLFFHQGRLQEWISTFVIQEGLSVFAFAFRISSSVKLCFL